MGMKKKIKSMVLHMPGGRRLVSLYRKLRTPTHFADTPEMKDRFTLCYTNKLWGPGESVSGPGSSHVYTENIRRELPPLIKRLGVKRLLDAPCGDYHWFRLMRSETEFEYIGGDIVAELIAENQKKYGDAHTRFMSLDITKDALPSADIWLCRDVLFHLSENAVFRAFHNFIHSDINAIIASSHPDCDLNTDIPTGIFRLQNLLLPPYSLPAPQTTINDWIEGFAKRHLCLWSREQVERAMQKSTMYQRAVAKLAQTPA